MFVSTSTLDAINESETALQAAWAAGAGDRAEMLRATVAGLWRRRRAELAAAAKRRRSAWDVMPCEVRAE